MGLNMNGHHLTSAIQMKIVELHVLTDEWQTVRQMYPIFCKEVEARTKLEPVLATNYAEHLRKMVKEGRAESKDSVQYTKNGAPVIHPAKLYRKRQPGSPLPRNACSQCGECCRWFVLCDERWLTQEQISYLYARGGKILQGFALIPSVCQHLRIDEFDPSKTKCAIYETRPQICANFCGRRKDKKGQRYYVPESCTMKP